MRSKPKAVGVTSHADIQTIVKIHEDLKQAFQRGGDVQLKLDAVSDVDLTFVQLVESARRYAAAEGRGFAVTPAPEVLRELLERGGFVSSPDDRSFWLGATGDR